MTDTRPCIAPMFRRQKSLTMPLLPLCGFARFMTRRRRS